MLIHMSKLNICCIVQPLEHSRNSLELSFFFFNIALFGIYCIFADLCIALCFWLSHAFLYCRCSKGDVAYITGNRGLSYTRTHWFWYWSHVNVQLQAFSSTQKRWGDTCFWFQHIGHWYSPVHPCKGGTTILNVLKNRTYTHVIEGKGTPWMASIVLHQINPGTTTSTGWNKSSIGVHPKVVTWL